MRPPVKGLSAFTAAALLLMGLMAGCAATDESVPMNGAASQEQAASVVEASSTAESEAEAASGVAAQEADAVEKYPQDGDYFVPFLPEAPPALPQGELTPVTSDDMDRLLAGYSQASWIYVVNDQFAQDVNAFQFRFMEENGFLASCGVYETDNGVFGRGTYRFLGDGFVEATAWVRDVPEDFEGDGPKSPVYFTMNVSWVGVDKTLLVVTLLTVEDTTPGQFFAYYLRATQNVPVPYMRKD